MRLVLRGRSWNFGGLEDGRDGGEGHDNNVEGGDGEYEEYNDIDIS